MTGGETVERGTCAAQVQSQNLLKKKKVTLIRSAQECVSEITPCSIYLMMLWKEPFSLGLCLLRSVNKENQKIMDSNSQFESIILEIPPHHTVYFKQFKLSV